MTIGTEGPAVPARGETVARPCTIAVEAAGDRVRLTALDQGGHLSPRLQHTDGFRATVALVANRASVLAGDHVRLEVSVGSGTALTLVEPAGTVAYHARGGSADYTIRIAVADGGLLLWDAAPLVMVGGAALRRSIAMDVAAGGSAVLRELLVLGRSNDVEGGRLYSRLRIAHDDVPLLVEDLDLWDPAPRRAAGMIGDARVLSTATMAGRKPEMLTVPGDLAPPGHSDAVPLYVSALAGPGGIARSMAAQAHLATAATDPIWAAWSDEAVEIVEADVHECRTPAASGP